MRTVGIGAGLELTPFVAGAPGAPTPVALGVDVLHEAWELGLRAVDVRDATVAQETAAARWLEDRQPEGVVLLAGIGAAADPGRGSDLSAARIERDLAAVVRHLGRVDVVWLRGADADTPLEATLTVLAEAVEAGRIRAFGAADLDVWGLEALLTAADRAELPRPILIRNRMNLLERADERDLLPLAHGEGVAAVPHAPLAGGRLTDAHIAAEEAAEADARRGVARTGDTDPDLARLLALRTLARERDVPVAALALAWLAAQPTIAAPVVAPSRPADWDAVHEALGIELTGEELERLGDL